MSSIVHFEIPADDLERAKTFYTKLFGWKIEGVPGMEDSMMVDTYGPVVGMMKRMPSKYMGEIIPNQQITNGSSLF